MGDKRRITRSVTKRTDRWLDSLAEKERTARSRVLDKARSEGTASRNDEGDQGPEASNDDDRMEVTVDGRMSESGWQRP
ncbi:hypothetical protein [Halalkalicoccus tibetensis]|uniref:Uncharacterized protein n=1 Tax=Halalkalicoccus tibetensis TaxID=175632 RepID=A0ABD5V0Z7_9EURY